MNRHILLCPESKNPQIIGAVNVVRMKMGDPDRIDMINAFSNQLKTKLGGRIHQKLPLW